MLAIGEGTDPDAILVVIILKIFDSFNDTLPEYLIKMFVLLAVELSMRIVSMRGVPHQWLAKHMGIRVSMPSALAASSTKGAGKLGKSLYEKRKANKEATE